MFRLARQDQPQIKIKDHVFLILAIGVLKRMGCTVLVLGRDKPNTQGANVSAARNLSALKHLRPGIDGIAGK